MIIFAVLALAALWIAGEALNKPMMRQIAGPLFAILLASIAYGVATIRTAFDDSIQYSGATKNFVSAIISAIDRGDVDAAHVELRKFDSESMETYEGGAFLRWLREPLKRLTDDAIIESSADAVTYEPAQANTLRKDGG